MKGCHTNHILRGFMGLWCGNKLGHVFCGRIIHITVVERANGKDYCDVNSITNVLAENRREILSCWGGQLCRVFYCLACYKNINKWKKFIRPTETEKWSNK